jgi:hypothetical protein
LARAQHLDVAVTSNMLLGGHFGLVTATETLDPGTLTHLHVEARAAYVFGHRHSSKPADQ